MGYSKNKLWGIFLNKFFILNKNLPQTLLKVKGIAETAAKSTDELLTQTKKSIDGMTVTARKSMDDLTATNPKIHL